MLIFYYASHSRIAPNSCDPLIPASDTIFINTNPAATCLDLDRSKNRQAIRVRYFVVYIRQDAYARHTRLFRNCYLRESA